MRTGALGHANGTEPATGAALGQAQGTEPPTRLLSDRPGALNCRPAALGQGNRALPHFSHDPKVRTHPCWDLILDQCG